MQAYNFDLIDFDIDLGQIDEKKHKQMIKEAEALEQEEKLKQEQRQKQKEQQDKEKGKQ